MRIHLDPLRRVTVADLRQCDALPISENMELPDESHLLRIAPVGQAQVVDAQRGDRLARDQGPAATTATVLPLTCGFQSKQAGSEVTFCMLPHNTCAFQRMVPGARAEDPAVCSDPHCVPTDWQVVTCAVEGRR